MNGGAIILTVDGSHRGAEGNLVRSFATEFPDAWEELDYEIEYPIPFGASRIYSIDPDTGCQFSHAIIASTLHHIGVMSGSEKSNVIGSALRSSLALSKARGVSAVCSTIMSGGWRMDAIEALDEMFRSYSAMESHDPSTSDMSVFIREELVYEKAMLRLNSIKYQS